MLWKAIKLGALTAAGAATLGGLVFGADLASYVRSSYSSVSHAVKDNIPIDFQLRRAKDLLDATGPEMRNNVRLMAEQEVDIGELKTDIARSKASLEDERTRLGKLRSALLSEQTSFTFGDLTYSREQLTEELARQFQALKEAEAAFQQKAKLLDSHQKTLAAAMEAMDTARTQRAALQTEIDALEGRYELVKATGESTNIEVDNSKLAQAEKVVAEVQRQLDISDHMLAEEAKFSSPIAIETIDEKDLLGQVDEHLKGAHAQPSQALTDAQQPAAQ